MRGKIVNPTFSHERLLEVLDYDPNTGELKWKVDVSKNVKAGMLAGGSKGYITVDKQDTTVPRIVWFYMTGEWPKYRVCCKNKNLKDFRFSNLEVVSGIEGYDHNNREERIAYHREYRKNYAPKYTEGDLKYKFGISLSEYSKLIIDQGNKCAICDQPETQLRNGRIKALAVDHDHETGKVRGLLCCACNQALGKFKDEKKLLLAAVAYLEKHSAEGKINPGSQALSTGPADAAETIGRNLLQGEGT
jgi:hypothetical protein